MILLVMYTVGFYTNEEFASKMLQIHFCVFEKNAVKVWNLLANALENF
jgi:hypothetical protein